jgi:GntR family transcriptional regulator, carbon starvation induced regulator
MIFRTEDGATSTTVAYNRLRDDVLQTVLAPGARLRIRAICERYEIGFNPAREALNRLVSEALVSQADHRGFTVAPVSKEDLIELTKTRCLLAEITLRESIKHGDATWEEQIVVAYHRWERARSQYETESVPYTKLGLAHREFHSALLAGCDATRLRSYNEQTFDHADRYRALLRRVYASRSELRAAKEHRQIKEATLARNTELATRRLIDHYERTRDVVLTYWDEIVKY